MRKLEVVEKRRVVDAFLCVDDVRVRYERLDGTMSAPVPRMCVEKCDAVAVLVHEVERDRLLFVRQMRYACLRHGDPFPLEVVAGGIDAGERPEEAAKREVLEEVGYEVKDLQPILRFYGSPGMTSEMLHVFYAPVRPSYRVHDGNAVEGEDLELVEMSPDEAFNLMDNDGIRDAKSQLALFWLRGLRRRVDGNP